MASDQIRCPSASNKENHVLSVDHILRDGKDSQQKSQEFDNTPWSISHLLGKMTRTPLAKNSLNKTDKDLSLVLSQSVTKRRSINRSEQTYSRTIASQLKKEAEYLETDFPEFETQFPRFPTEERPRMKQQTLKSSLKSNSFIFNIIQDNKSVPKREYPKKYIRLHNQSYKSVDLGPRESQQTILFNKISRKGTQQTSRLRRKVKPPIKQSSTQHIRSQNQAVSFEGQKVFNSFNKLIRGRKLKLLKSKMYQFA